MDKTLKTALTERADELGFDSVQALLRYVAKALADRRTVTFGEDDWGQASPEAAARLNKWADEARRGENVSGPYETVEEMMTHLRSL